MCQEKFLRFLPGADERIVVSFTETRRIDYNFEEMVMISICTYTKLCIALCSSWLRVLTGKIINSVYFYHLLY